MSTKITIKNNGPIFIEGEFEIVDATGAKFELGEKKAVALCRCGQSKKMPFCDGSHKACEFKSEVDFTTR